MFQLLAAITISIIICVDKFAFATDDCIQCGENEILEPCINHVCAYKECSELWEPKECSIGEKKHCKKGCMCKENYLKADDGKCIPANQCPNALKCTKENEYYDLCPSNCPARICGVKDTHCTKVLYFGDIECPPPACRCKGGFYRNIKTGDCVVLNMCPIPIVCGVNEVHSDCVNGGCGKWNCSQPIEVCRNIKEGECIEGCHCKEGYLRADNGTCITADQCPTITSGFVCGPNEVYDTCVDSGCERHYCSQPDDMLDLKPLPKDCEEGCQCKEGFLKNDDDLCIPTDECSIQKTLNGLVKFQQGIIAFTTKCLYEAVKANPGVSLTLSPFSISFLLAQLLLYTSGKLPQQQLLQVLNLKNKHELWSIMEYYLDTLSFGQDVTFDRVENVFANNQYTLSQSFKKVTKKYFNSRPRNLDFSNKNFAATDINTWTETKTHNKITNILLPKLFDQNTILVLLSAVYFKGHWKDKFDHSLTKKESFLIDENTSVAVNMMKRSGSYEYADISYLDAKVIKIPYHGEKLSFMIWLPNSYFGVNAMVEKLKDFSGASLWSSVLNYLEPKELDVSIPYFEITTSIDMINILKKNNVTSLFNPDGTSGVSGMFVDPKPAHVSVATQKTSVVVNDSGEGGLVQDLISPVLGILSTSKKTKFNAHHSFLYFVSYEDNPILCGLYAGPNKAT